MDLDLNETNFKYCKSEQKFDFVPFQPVYRQLLPLKLHCERVGEAGELCEQYRVRCPTTSLVARTSGFIKSKPYVKNKSVEVAFIVTKTKEKARVCSAKEREGYWEWDPMPCFRR